MIDDLDVNAESRQPKRQNQTGWAGADDQHLSWSRGSTMCHIGLPDPIVSRLAKADDDAPGQDWSAQ